MKTSNDKFSMPAYRRRAFSLIELLVVIAVIAIGASLIFPGIDGRHGCRSKIASDLNNKKQLQLCCQMYIQDENGYLPPNSPIGNKAVRDAAWICNTEGWGTKDGNTNTAIYNTDLLAPYHGGQLKVYKSPFDTVPSQNGDRIRSVSMNCCMGVSQTNQAVMQCTSGFKKFQKESDVAQSALSPSMAWMFCNESPYSINDGCLLVDLTTPDYKRCPAWYDDGGNVFSFCDGHVEYHKWQWSGTPTSGLLNTPLKQNVSNQGQAWGSSSQDVDYQWLCQHTSCKLSSSEK